MTGLQACTNCKLWNRCMTLMLKNPLAISIDCTREVNLYEHTNALLTSKQNK